LPLYCLRCKVSAFWRVTKLSQIRASPSKEIIIFQAKYPLLPTKKQKNDKKNENFYYFVMQNTKIIHIFASGKYLHTINYLNYERDN